MRRICSAICSTVPMNTNGVARTCSADIVAPKRWASVAAAALQSSVCTTAWITTRSCCVLATADTRAGYGAATPSDHWREHRLATLPLGAPAFSVKSSREWMPKMLYEKRNLFTAQRVP